MKKLGFVLIALMLVVGTTYAQERGSGRPSQTGQRPSQAAGAAAGQRPSQAGGQGQQGRPGGQGGFNGQRMDPEQMIKMQTQRLTEELKLTKDQETKVTAIYKKYTGNNNNMDFQKMRDASDAERTKMREEMQKTRDKQEAEIKAVLTPAQVKTYDENMKKRQEQMRNGQGRQGGFGGGQGGGFGGGQGGFGGGQR